MSNFVIVILVLLARVSKIMFNPIYNCLRFDYNNNDNLNIIFLNQKILHEEDLKEPESYQDFLQFFKPF